VPRRWLLLIGLLAAACGGSTKAATPSASVTTPPTTAHPTTTLTVEAQVEAAYLHSWDVYAKAVETLDPSHLSEAFAQPHLGALKEELADRTRRQRPQHVSVDHHISVQVTDADTAAVRDVYVNHMIEFDPTTGQPTEADPNETVSDTYTLKRIEGTWKVTFVVRQRP